MSALALEEVQRADPRDMRVAVLRQVVPQTPDTSTYWFALRRAADRAAFRFQPGQFNMLYVFGQGEVPISISSDPAHTGRLGHTIRSTGRVTEVFRSMRKGDEIGLRGPFGRPWPVGRATGGDLLIVAGGLGLAPVKSAINEAMRSREAFRRIVVLVGARGPEHMLFRRELEAWMHLMRHRGIEMGLTVDVGDDAWPYNVGVVTTLFDGAQLDPVATTAFVCGPETMMRFAAEDLVERGLAPDRLWVSLERNMQCAVRLCGHCQLGPKFVCADGPVFRWNEVAGLLEVAEL